MVTIRRRMPGLRLAGLVALFAQCSSGDGDGAKPIDGAVFDADDGDGLFVGCADDPRADKYSSGAVKMGNGGKLQVRLLSADPAPPVKGINSWSIEIDDPQGMPISASVMKVTPYMPDHGHGTSVTPVATAVGTDGRYTISPLYLYMAGLWQVTLDLTTSAGVRDAVIFSFCVDH